MSDSSPPLRYFCFRRLNVLWRIIAADRAEAERILCRALGIPQLDQQTIYQGESEISPSR